MTKARTQRTHDHLIGTVRTITNPARTGYGWTGPVSTVMYLPHGSGTDIFLRFWDTERSVNYQAYLSDTSDAEGLLS